MAIHIMDAGAELFQNNPMSVICSIVHLRDRWSCDVRIQDTYLVALGCHCVCEGSCHEGFTYAALAADNTDDVFYI